MKDDRPILVPFLKWAGGKRWLTAQCPGLFPKSFERHVEPFLGSGAVYFHLAPAAALIADSNSDLIGTYLEVRSSWRQVERALKRHHRNHNEGYYYAERARKHSVGHERAAQFIYLNRTCWNGLYRVNLRGQFNVPIGTKTAVYSDSDDFKSVSALLGRARIVASDFESIIDQAERGDFLFVDPPYITRHNFNGFVKYNDKLFSWTDQERLASSIRRASRRRVKILITNADHPSIHKLYFDVGHKKIIRRHSVLAADSNNRGAITELVIAMNYEIDS
jgi:DNA adenine methylase